MAKVSSAKLDAVLLSNLVAAGKKAGYDAVEKLQVRAMVVYEADLLSGKAKPGGQSWYVADGVCGFAWVNVYGIRGKKRDAFKALGFDQSDYDRCLKYWVGEFNQSMQKKEVFAEELARALREAGYKAYSGSRMD